MLNVTSITEETGVTLLELPNGQFIGIDLETVCLYNSKEEFYDATSEIKPTWELKPKTPKTCVVTRTVKYTWEWVDTEGKGAGPEVRAELWEPEADESEVLDETWAVMG